MILGQLHERSHVGLRSAKMETVSEVLQLPVIIEGSRPLSAESQFLQKRDFLLGRIPAEGRILMEVFELRLFIERLFGFPFHKRNLLRGSRIQSGVCDNVLVKSREVDASCLNERSRGRD